MSRNISEDLNNPRLFDEYKPGEYEYGSSVTGGKTATGSLVLSDSPERDAQAQRSAGGEERRDNDHEWGADDGGHLIGARFAGSSGEENLTAQNRNLNRSDYKNMENNWADHLNAGDKVFVHMETDQSDRPNAYMGYAIYESPDGTRTYDDYHFVNESRAEHAQWEEDALAYDDQYMEGISEMDDQANDDMSYVDGMDMDE